MAETKRIITILLRLLALGATLSATVVMVTSHDSSDVLNLKFSAKYNNSPTFKYYVIAEAIATGYSFIVLFLSSRSLVWRLIVILDVVIAMLLTSSISAALAIAQVGKKGNSHADKLENDHSLTGTAYDFERATTSLTRKSLSTSKKVTLVRHGLSSWNEEGRVQGSSNLSVLTETGVKQAERCRQALGNMHFDQCFSSPISRAKGENFLVVTHKSMLRALICTALGLAPERFRSIDVNNGGISTFNISKRGEAMLQSLNMTAHVYSDHMYLS
ncbi:hypothetical protein CRYUN_Cryun31cG0028900 [Craigia yunnanensis]